MTITRCRNCIYYNNKETYNCKLFNIKRRPESFCDCGEGTIQEHYMPERTATWIRKNDSYICSYCNEQSCCAGDFCPDCGAKMINIKEEIL